MKNTVFKRRPSSPSRRYKTLILVVCEGKTEENYINKLKPFNTEYCFEIINSGNRSDPNSLLECIDQEVKKRKIYKGDIVAIILDSDMRKPAEFEKLLQWQEKGKKLLCISAPQFEYWLILHKSKGSGITSKKDCLKAFKGQFPSIRKPNIPSEIMNPESISQAIRNSQIDNVPEYLESIPCKGTNLHHLVKKIIDET